MALGYAAIRAGYTVRFVHADDFFRSMAQARVDNSVGPDLQDFPHSRTCSLWMTWDCTGSQASSQRTSTS